MNQEKALKLCLLLFLLGLIALIFQDQSDTSLLFQEAYQRLLGQESWSLLLDERLPRALVLSLSGASLAAAGAVMQSIFKNPLASPSSLGITSGGSLLALLGLYLGWGQTLPFSIALLSFSGCLLTLYLVFFFSKLTPKNPQNLLLIGIALATFLSAIEGFCLLSLRNHWPLLPLVEQWLSGSSEGRAWFHVQLLLPLSLAGIWGILKRSHEADLLALGDEEASALGMDVEQSRWELFFLISLLTGGSLAAIGHLPFLGLLLPHCLRAYTGPILKKLLPFCLIVGAGSLIWMDVLLRMWDNPNLTLGQLCSLLGGAGFLLLLLSTTGSLRYARS